MAADCSQLTEKRTYLYATVRLDSPSSTSFEDDVSCVANSPSVGPRPRKVFTHIYSPHQVILSTLLTHLGYRLTLSGIKATGIEWGVPIHRLYLHYLFNIKSSMHTGIIMLRYFTQNTVASE